MPVRAEERSSTASETKRPAVDRVLPTVTSSVQAPAGLDWLAFTAASFPGRRRHDLEALTAYSAYKRSRDAGTDSSAEPAVAEPGRGASGATALRDWEDEGGATLSPDGP